MSLRLENLSRQHRPLLRDFQCGEPELDTYIHGWALNHQERDLIGRTWLAIDDSIDGGKLAGFFTLAASMVDRALLQSGPLNRLPGFPVPAVLLARLAVDHRLHGQGLGTWLFDRALLKTVALATDGPIGFRVLATDAKDERAATFYERRGLTRLHLAGPWPRTMVLDLRPLIPPDRNRP